MRTLVFSILTIIGFSLTSYAGQNVDTQVNGLSIYAGTNNSTPYDDEKMANTVCKHFGFDYATDYQIGPSADTESQVSQLLVIKEDGTLEATQNSTGLSAFNQLSCDKYHVLNIREDGSFEQ